MAGDGAGGVLLDHRLHDLGGYERAAADVAAPWSRRGPIRGWTGAGTP
ncbi:hypothetical protein [Streptomyces sp. IBSBF 2507]